MMADATETIMSTDRLALRRFQLSDARPLQALCDNWEIARMTTRIPHPYTLEDATAWISGHEGAFDQEKRFAIICDGTLIGAAGLIAKADTFEIAYWLGQPYWGQGFATEVAARLCRFAFEDLSAEYLVAGHFAGNDASARVLAKCGFRYTGEEDIYSLARDTHVTALRMELHHDALPDSLEGNLQ